MVRFLSYTALPFRLAFSVTSGAPSRRSMAVLDQRELPDYFAHAGKDSGMSVASVGKETSAELSGGGFSDLFPRPSYQNTSVATYLSTLGDTHGGKFSPNGRAFPDVAAQGFDEFLTTFVLSCICQRYIVLQSHLCVIALINDRRVSAGKSPLGFLNPLYVFLLLATSALRNTSSASSLYLNPGAFFDITTGSNPGCGTHGFSAGVGWDPVTGLGTPNFAALLAAAGA
ncbi:peptidase S8/S53 domain-containing protein [Lentinula detonsa]|uniref:Peptidase S8/S53 domain-containing protein n=1 Tax=Lentinula detonsa TaxID=2804962 RepID=A0A9W8U0L2_9AGAR|nr:peptidase S8/S53 domain-containing protein [Lentinula detonsa]